MLASRSSRPEPGFSSRSIPGNRAHYRGAHDDRFAICAAFVIRRLQHFPAGQIPSPTAAYDYLLPSFWHRSARLRAALLEAQFRFLGPNSRYHLLLYSLIYMAAAYRYSSATVLSLALSSFAAWRGVSASSCSAAIPDIGFATIPSSAARCSWRAASQQFEDSQGSLRRGTDSPRSDPRSGNARGQRLRIRARRIASTCL